MEFAEYVRLPNVDRICTQFRSADIAGAPALNVSSNGGKLSASQHISPQSDRTQRKLMWEVELSGVFDVRAATR